MSGSTERADVQRATEWLALVNESPMSNRAKSGPTLRCVVHLLATDVLSLAAALREKDEALRKYGRHVAPCPKVTSGRTVMVCTCGLDAALAAASTEGADAPVGVDPYEYRESDA